MPDENDIQGREELDLSFFGIRIRIAIRIKRAFGDFLEVGGTIWSGLGQGTRYVSGPLRNKRERARISKAFGVGSDVNLHPGDDHPLYQAGPHPDNIDCANTLSIVLAQGKLSSVHRRSPLPLDESAYLLGSPTSTQPVRSVAGYFDAGQLVIPGDEPPLNYEWFFQWPEEDWSFQRYIGRRMEQRYGGRIVGKDGKPIIDRIRTDASHYQSDDWLIVMRLPNLLNKAAFDKGKELMVIAGVQGVGTKAFPLLISSQQHEVKRLLGAIGKARYYQAMFHIEAIEHDHANQQSIPIATSIKFIDAHVLQVDPDRITRWFERVTGEAQD